MSTGWDLGVGGPPAAAAAPLPPAGRASWWRTLGQGLLAALVLFTARIVLDALALLAGAGPGAVVGRVLWRDHGWPPFTGAPLANAAVVLLGALAFAAALQLTVRSRAGFRPPFAWTLAGALTGATWAMVGSGAHRGSWALVIALVIVRQCGYRSDGTPAPGIRRRRAAIAAVAVAGVVAAAVVVARSWMDPIVVSNGSSEPALSQVPAHDLAPADRTGRVHVLRLLVENAGPRTVAIQSGRLVGPGAQGRLIGLRRTQTGSWTSDQPYYLPYRPVRVAPGEDAELDLLVAGGCHGLGPLTLRLDHSAGHSDLPLAHVLAGPRCRS